MERGIQNYWRKKEAIDPMDTASSKGRSQGLSLVKLNKLNFKLKATENHRWLNVWVHSRIQRKLSTAFLLFLNAIYWSVWRPLSTMYESLFLFFLLSHPRTHLPLLHLALPPPGSLTVKQTHEVLELGQQVLMTET